MQVIKLSLAVKAKWLLILGCILASSVLTVVVNLVYDGMRYNNLLDKIIWGGYECTCEFSCKSCLFPVAFLIILSWCSLLIALNYVAAMHVLMSLVALSIWVMAYPKNYRPVWIALIGVAAFVFIMPGGLARACRGTVITALQVRFVSMLCPETFRTYRQRTLIYADNATSLFVSQTWACNPNTAELCECRG